MRYSCGNHVILHIILPTQIPGPVTITMSLSCKALIIKVKKLANLRMRKLLVILLNRMGKLRWWRLGYLTDQTNAKIINTLRRFCLKPQFSYHRIKCIEELFAFRNVIINVLYFYFLSSWCMCHSVFSWYILGAEWREENVMGLMVSDTLVHDYIVPHRTNYQI